MRTIKYLLLGLFAVISLGTQAKDLTPQQKQYLETVANFLRQEGFSPSFDEDNSLVFKKEGTLYWIDIQNESPYFISFHRAGMGASDADTYAVYRACNDVNADRMCVKTYLMNGSITIVCEMYLNSANEFKKVFYDNLKQLDMAYDGLKDSYAKYDPS